jgi:hypothetical protein
VHYCSSASKHIFSTKKVSQFQSQAHAKACKLGLINFTCRARRRVRYVEEEEEGDEEYGNNLEITMLETYSENKSKEALLVKATVDGEEELVLIFKVNTNSETNLQLLTV